MSFIALILALSLSVAVHTQSCETLFPDHDTMAYDEGCLVMATYQNFGFFEAESYCEDLGGQLVTIHSQEKQDLVHEFISPYSPALFWIGMTDEVVEGQWVWVDGTPLDYSNWGPYLDNYGGVEHYGQIASDTGKWNDLPETYNAVYPVCEVVTCENYDGEYIAGFQQCGFDQTHFEGDYTEIDDIDVILENLENQFIDEANYQLELLNSAFSDKESAHSVAVSSESAYEQAMQARVAAESAYNSARVQEESAHSTLLEAVSALQTAIEAYDAQYATYSEQIEFLNYELYIIHEIRELLGDSLDYVPIQTVLEAAEHDPTYSDYVNAYPTLMSSAYADHRFGGSSSNDEDRTRGKKKKKRSMKKKRAKKRSMKKKRVPKKKQTKRRTPKKKQTKKRMNKRAGMKKRALK